MVKEEQKGRILNSLTKVSIWFKDFIHRFLDKTTFMNFTIDLKKILIFLMLYCFFVINRYIFLFFAFFFIFKVFDSLLNVLNGFFANKNKSYFCLSLFFTFFVYVSFKIQNMLLLTWSLLLLLLIKNVDIILNKIVFVDKKKLHILFVILSIVIISMLFSLISNYNILSFLIFDLTIFMIIYLVDKFLYRYFINDENKSIIMYLIYVSCIGLIFIVFNLLGIVKV